MWHILVHSTHVACDTYLHTYCCFVHKFTRTHTRLHIFGRSAVNLLCEPNWHLQHLCPANMCIVCSYLPLQHRVASPPLRQLVRCQLNLFASTVCLCVLNAAFTAADICCCFLLLFFAVFAALLLSRLPSHVALCVGAHMLSICAVLLLLFLQSNEWDVYERIAAMVMVLCSYLPHKQTTFPDFVVAALLLGVVNSPVS